MILTPVENRQIIPTMDAGDHNGGQIFVNFLLDFHKYVCRCPSIIISSKQISQNPSIIGSILLFDLFNSHSLCFIKVVIDRLVRLVVNFDTQTGIHNTLKSTNYQDNVCFLIDDKINLLAIIRWISLQIDKAASQIWSHSTQSIEIFSCGISLYISDQVLCTFSHRMREK